MSDPMRTPEFETELAVQAVVAAVQALDDNADRLRPELGNLIFAAAKLNAIIEAIGRKLAA